MPLFLSVRPRNGTLIALEYPFIFVFERLYRAILGYLRLCCFFEKAYSVLSVL